MVASRFPSVRTGLIAVLAAVGLMPWLSAQEPAPTNEASMDMGASSKGLGGPARDMSVTSARENPGQAAGTYRATAAGLRKAADQAPPDEKQCYFRWAAYDEAIASAIEAGSQVTDPQPDCQLGVASPAGTAAAASPTDLANRRAEQQRILDEALRDQRDAERQLANLSSAVGRSGDPSSHAKEEERLRGKLGVAQLRADQARQRLNELDRAAAAPPPAPEVPKDYAIPSLRAEVVQLRFYASGPDQVPVSGRQYSTSFPAAQSQFIAFQVDLEHPPAEAAQTFTMVCTYTWPDGSSSAVEVEGHVEAGWTGSSHSGGKGWSEPGRWKVGEYRVSCIVDGRTIASGTFQVL